MLSRVLLHIAESVFPVDLAVNAGPCLYALIKHVIDLVLVRAGHLSYPRIRDLISFTVR